MSNLTKAKPRWKLLARHVNNWVAGATITESVLTDHPDEAEFSIRRFTATIEGFEGFKIFEGPAYERMAEDVRQRVRFIKDRIDRGDEQVFYDCDPAERSYWIGSAYVDGRLTFPRGKRFAHLIGIDGRGNGFFLANNREMIVDRKTFKEIAQEARDAGASTQRWFIYGRLCTYSGPGIEFMQIGAKD